MRRSARYLLICFLLSPLSAQMITEDGGAETSHKWALQLQSPTLLPENLVIPENRVWNGDIGGVYLLRKVSPRAALRMGASFMVQTPTKPPRSWIDYRLYDATGLTIHNTPTKLRQVTFHVQAIGYAPPSGQATLYFGYGPLFAISREHQEEDPNNWLTRTMWSVGMQGVFGISIALKSRLNLLLEYQPYYAEKFYKQKSRYYSRFRTWTYSETVRQIAPQSPIPQLGISLQFK